MPNRKGKPAGIKEVARMAGVSISTVSNVINGTKRVSEELKMRVSNAIKELNYQTNHVGRQLKTGKSIEIAVVVPTVTSIFLPNLLKSIQNAADQAGYFVSIFSTKGNIEQEWNVISMLHSRGIRGILVSSCADVDSPQTKKYTDFLHSVDKSSKSTNIVCMEAAISNQLDAVVFNDAEGIASAVRHLMQCGCQHFAHISTPRQYQMGKNRCKGFVTELLYNGFSLDERLILEGLYTCQSGYDAMKKLLATGLPIDAVVSGNDQMAIGAINYLKEQGIRIPQDIAVTGFNDNTPASLISPSLTTIRVPKAAMGVCAFDLLLKRINGDQNGRLLIQLDGELVIRNSTNPTAESVWDMDW